MSPHASWNPNGTTFANSSIIGTNPYGIFVTVNNTIYASNKGNGRIQIWSNNSLDPTKTIFGNLVSPWSIFVTMVGDIFVDNDGNGRVDKFTVNTNTSTPVMYGNSACFGLVVDTANTLYCSMYTNHQVVKRWLNDNSNLSTIVAGNGMAGNSTSMLNGPHGIFVDVNLDLYVADCSNNRVQLFQLGQSNGITVAGSTSINITITLSCPASVVLDADGYLFIADEFNQRIVGSGPDGFRCIVGCPGTTNASSPLRNPCGLSFDIFGNLYVMNYGGHKIMKFLLINSSGKSMKVLS